MTIKEMEERSGLQRANIRFYEQEGLLAPQRLSNGYRDYSDSDLQQLHRIHLLRTLGLSLDEIRAAQKGEASLDSLLAQHAHALEQQAAHSQQRAQLCRRIRQDGAQYETLDGRRWLDTLAEDEPTAAAVPPTDACHKVTAPWRRLFARYFDLFLYSSLWIMLGTVLIGQAPSTQTAGAWNGLSSLISVGAMLLVEPLLLRVWGTTPGKWLLGLSVRSNTGSKLSYGEGLYRTAQALWHGAAFFIPIFSLFRGYQRYYDCTEGKTLAWEWDSELTLKDEKPWRIAACLGAVIAQGLLLIPLTAAQANPPHRGDMTVTEFAENYNHFSDYYDFDLWLNEEGRWAQKPRPDGSYVITMGGVDTPHFIYNEKDGVLMSLTASTEVKGDTGNWISLHHNRRILAILAFAQAYDPTPLNNDEVVAVIRKLQEHPLTALDETVHGVRITWEFSATGYHISERDGLLVPIEGQTPSCSMVFTMEKVS